MSRTARNFFPGFNIRLYDKNSNSFFFFSSTKIRIFFSATLGIRISFYKKNHNPPPPPLSVKWSFPKGVFCLIISYLQIKSYNVLNYNNCSTDWPFPLRHQSYLTGVDAALWNRKRGHIYFMKPCARDIFVSLNWTWSGEIIDLKFSSWI